MSKPNLSESKIVKRFKNKPKTSNTKEIDGYFQLLLEAEETVIEEVVFGFNYITKPFINYNIEANVDDLGVTIHVKQITFNSVTFVIKNTSCNSLEFRVNYRVDGESAM
jgi:hypothetical protein